MNVVPQTLSNTFNKFFDSEKSSGILLILYGDLSCDCQFVNGRRLFEFLAKANQSES